MTSPSSTTSVGRSLRAARVARGESLAEAAERTRISDEYLEALERDAPLGSFPAPAYARMFLRAYARHLGLDENTLAAAFAARHGGDGAQPPVVLPVEDPTSRGRTARIPMASLPGGAGPKGAPSSRRLPAGRFIRTLPLRFSSTPRPDRRLQHVLAAAILVAVAGLVFLVRAFILHPHPAPTGSGGPSPSARPPASFLPRGGRTIFPAYRVVAYYGTGRTEALGVLGVGPAEAARRVSEQADQYRSGGRPVMPAFEFIATLASGSPGSSGLYRIRQGDLTIQSYLKAVRGVKGLFFIDLQPGRGPFLAEAKAYESFLKEPDVGLALDSGWHVGPGEVPGKVPGSVDASTINAVARYLSGIVRRYNLPQKLLIVHQFTHDMVRNKKDVGRFPGVAITFDIDGSGDPANKISKYDALTHTHDGFFHGLKLFYRQDVDLMAPRAVLQLRPMPDLVIYQ